MLIRTTLLLILFAFTVAAGNLSAETLHLFIVGDTHSNLQSQVEKDVALIQEQGVRLAKDLGFACHYSVFTGEEAAREIILSTIRRQHFEKEDLVLFYFSGHGYRTKEKKSRWPNLYFTPGDHGMELDEVIQVLQEKSPRFALVIADCCNNFFVEGQKMPPTTYYDFQAKVNPRYPQSIKTLFASSRGVLVLSGASAGGFSWATSDGGILTFALFDALTDVRLSSSTWAPILKKVEAKTSHIQKIQYEHYF